MAEKPFRLEIITPRRTVFTGDVLSFSAPGVVGGFQVLKSHAALLSSIEVGEVKVVDAAGLEFRFATSGGFVEVRDNVVVMLAETAERADEIDASRAAAAKERARKRLSERGEEVEITRAEAALKRALNRIKVASRS